MDQRTELKPSALHRNTEQGSRYCGLLSLASRVVWSCEHMHTTGWAALECAEAALQSPPGSVQDQQLRELLARIEGPPA